MSNLRTLGVTATVLAVSLASLDQAQAVPILRLSSGADVIEVTDNSADDASAIEGVVAFVGGLDGWLISVTTGLSKPAIGSETDPELDLSSVSVSSAVSGMLVIELTDTDYLGGPLMRGSAAIGGTTEGSVSFQTYYGDDNDPFARSNLLTDLGAFTSWAFSDTAGSVLSVDGTYSLTSVVTITHRDAWQTTSFDAALKVPEPGSLALLGAGLLVLGGVRGRRTTG